MTDHKRPDPLDSDPGAEYREQVEREKEEARRHRSEAAKVLRQTAEYIGEVRIHVREIRGDVQALERAVDSFDDDLQAMRREVEHQSQTVAAVPIETPHTHPPGPSPQTPWQAIAMKALDTPWASVILLALLIILLSMGGSTLLSRLTSAPLPSEAPSTPVGSSPDS